MVPCCQSFVHDAYTRSPRHTKQPTQWDVLLQCLTAKPPLHPTP